MLKRIGGGWKVKGGGRILCRLFCAFFFVLGLSSFNPPPSTLYQFKSPIDYEISLAGNFGEPRPNHFHGGLDIRTEGVEGKHIYAIADGYVSRVTVGLYGFGNAIYITHPTGQTSVYCHLKSFSPRIKRALRRYQYQHNTSEADARLSPLDVPVSQGQFIALSGNTGSSTAPHLHLEIHDTRTWNMLDPYRFLNNFIQDTVAPQAHAFMAIPQGGAFNGSTQNSSFSIHPPMVGTEGGFTAWGRVGFAVWADDYMQGSYNHFGIHETMLYVDGEMVFHSVVDDIPVSMNRMVNSWGYYDHWLHHRRWYMKSFIEPGNTLPCLLADRNRGIIDFNEERDYHLEYVLRDFKGNEVRYPFTVRGTAPATTASIASPEQRRLERASLCWNRTNSYSRPGLQLIVPYGFVAADTPLQPVVVPQPDALSDACQFSPSSLPLMADARLCIYARRTNTQAVAGNFDASKLYIANEQGRYMGGDYHNGWVTGYIRELGSRYQVVYDDLPPAVQPIALNGDRLLLSVTDAQSGIAKWTATVDDRFIVFDAIEKTTTYACDLRESWLRRTGGLHRLRFEATDNRQNTCVYETAFEY